MKVICEKCGTAYNLPDDKVTEKGTPVKCSRCGQVFVVRRAPAVVPIVLEEEAVQLPIEPPIRTAPKEPEIQAPPAPAHEPALPIEEPAQVRVPKAQESAAKRVPITPVAAKAASAGHPALKVLAALILSVGLFCLAYYIQDTVRKTESVWSRVDEQTSAAEKLEKEMKAREPMIRASDLAFEAKKLANLWTTEGREKAKKDIEESLKANPALAIAHAVRAELLIDKAMDEDQPDPGDLDSAERSAHAAVEMDPELPDGYRALAACAWLRKNIDKAQEYLAQARSKSGNDAETLLLQARIALDQKKMDKAVESLKASLAADPLLFQSNLLMAKLYANRKDWDTALQYVQAALAISPDQKDGLAAASNYEDAKSQKSQKNPKAK